MKQHLPLVLRGAFAAMAAPSPEAGPAFAGAQAGAAALLVFLAAQELDKDGALDAENEQLTALLAAAARDGYTVDAPPDGDAEMRNAALRRSITALHAVTERRGDAAWDRRLIATYRMMAQRWQVELPG